MNHEQLDHLTRYLLISPEVFRRRIEKDLLKSAMKDLQLDLAVYHLLVMQTLAEEGGQTVNEIGEKLAISKSQMTFATDHLIDLGMIIRQSDDEDRRKIRIDLTLKGRWVSEQLTKNIRQYVASFLGDLRDEEIDQMVEGLKLLYSVTTR